jgi:3-dehydroquinate synthase
MTHRTRIRVAAESPYDVIVGHDLLDEAASVLPESVRRVGVICSPRQQPVAQAVVQGLIAAGLQAHLVPVPDGEQAKTADVAAMCWAQLGKAGFTRSDAVIGIGGGATTDLAGFVAATFLRGLAVVHLPTTLLGMVDAAVGGKTGINTAEGKNLVGAFHEPAAVLCDLSVLATLPPDEVASGLAEVVKCGFIADPEILRRVEADPAAAGTADSAVFRELVERAVTVKAQVVAGDLREATSVGSAVGREALNYGHTLGHAIERVEDYRIRHGAGVAIGMVYVAELASLAGVLDEATVHRHRDVLSSLGLPTTYARVPWPRLHDAMRIDKKARGDRLRLVVLEEIGHPAILEAPEPELLEAAYQRITSQRPG